MRLFKKNPIKKLILRFRMDLAYITYQKECYEFIRRAGLPGELEKFELKKRPWFVWAWKFFKRFCKSDKVVTRGWPVYFY